MRWILNLHFGYNSILLFLHFSPLLSMAQLKPKTQLEAEGGNEIVKWSLLDTRGSNLGLKESTCKMLEGKGCVFGWPWI